MNVEAISRNKRRRFCERFDENALGVLPTPQRALLLEWLKSATPIRRWEVLLKTASHTRIELAESLAQSLVDCGAAVLEECLERSNWMPVALIWRDYEALCSALGLTTQSVQRTAFSASWTAAQHVEWQHAALSTAHRLLQEVPPARGQGRLSLLIKLNEWISEGRSGTRRDFSLFARGHTKQISAAEWTWLSEIVDLVDCAIERHAPALWLAGEVQLNIKGRWLDIGAAGDFIALTPMTLGKLTASNSRATHYRLIENRTSFERIARKQQSRSEEIVIWLPGYAPNWWRAAVSQLVTALPLPARISCDADPDGVQITLHAAELWAKRGLAWEPYAMSAVEAASSRHKLAMTERDTRLAATLLNSPDLPSALTTLLQWCMDHNRKAEQENWL